MIRKKIMLEQKPRDPEGGDVAAFLLLFPGS
jgi:hypothetical protein